MTDLKSKIKGFIVGRTIAPYQVRKTLKEVGDITIVSMTVCRVPLNHSAQKLAQIVSRGKYKQRIKELGYDDIYHLFVLVKLENGDYYRLEKRHVVVISLGDSLTKGELPNSQCIPVQLGNNQITMNDLIVKGEALSGPNNFWIYRLLSTNCQNFVLTILKANNLLTPEIEKFVTQDALEVAKTIPSIWNYLAQTFNDIEARLDILKHGYGRTHKCRRHGNMIYC
jgi:hypothetical protein